MIESEQLWLLKRDGPDALARSFVGYHGRLRKMVEFRLDPRVATRVDPDDILQESYLEAARRLDEYISKPDVPLFIWLRFLVAQQVQTAHRRHLETNKRSVGREVRSHRVGERASKTLSILWQLIGSDTSPSLAVARSELQANLREMIDRLDESAREILYLRHFEELSNLEVAAELSISTAAASKRYTRALHRLRETLCDDGL